MPSLTTAGHQLYPRVGQSPRPDALSHSCGRIILLHPPTLTTIGLALACGLLSSTVPFITDLQALRRIPTGMFGIFTSVIVEGWSGQYYQRYQSINICEVAMSDRAMQQPEEPEIDVRTLARHRRHPVVFEAYQRLPIGQSLILVNDHEPLGLRDEFERELAGSFGWETVSADDGEHLVRITKHASTALPRVVADTTTLLQATGPKTGGSIWQLEPGARDLDANIIALPANDEIGLHIGPNLDVLILVLQGSGELHTEVSMIPLVQGQILWLPRNAQRRFVAGPNGVQYFTVHHRKPTLNITAGPSR